MRCPFCGSDETKVIDSRSDNIDSVRRRRQCDSCGERFTTFEIVEFAFPNVEKSNGVVEKFDAAKILSGVVRATEKRGIADDEIDAMITRIKRQFSHSKREAIPAREIGEAVMRELRALDAVAYVRFASVYRRFEVADAFTEEVASLQNNDDQ